MVTLSELLKINEGEFVERAKVKEKRQKYNKIDG